MVESTPNREIHSLIKACATVTAQMPEIVMASSQRVNLSIQVSRYVKPCDVGRGPTKSMCIWSNLTSGGCKWHSGVVGSLTVKAGIG